MNPTAPATDLERRKHVKLKLRPDLSIAPQKYEGRTYWVVKDPISMRYYRFKEQEYFLLQFMDGEHTLDEAQKEYEKRFRPERLKLEDLEHFGQQLLTAGLAQNESPRAGKQLFDRRKKRLRTEWMQTFTNILYIKIPVFDPDKLLNRMLPYCGWVFSGWFLILAHLYFAATLVFVAIHFDSIWERLPNYQEFFTLGRLGWMWLALGVVKVIHEFGHGLSCRKFKGEVHEMGLLFLCLSPCLYCNVSDAWTLPNKWKRILISYAGIYVELFIAATATFVWWLTPAQPFINNLALCLMVVCSISTIFFNANPLMRYDGYYVMSDWLEIPNLRDRANRFLKNTVLEHCLGVEVQPEQYMATGRKVLFITYAIVSYFYRWWITFKILTFMATFLKPYKLEVISKMLAMAALGSMIGWPLWRLGKNLHRRGRLPDMKSGRVAVSAIIVAVVVIAFFTVPLPVARITQTGLVQLQDEAEAAVMLRVDGRLEELKVKDGSYVNKGEELAVLSNRELEGEFDEIDTKVKILTKKLSGYQQQQANDKGTKPQVTKDIADGVRDTQQELTKAQGQLEGLRTQIQSLRLVAPRDGWVINPPELADLGKFYDQASSGPFCLIGDPKLVRMAVPVKPSEYRRLKQDREDLLAKGQDLPVIIRIKGRGTQTWEGEWLPMPQSETTNIPYGLSDKGGGPISVKQPTAQEPNKREPKDQQYLIYLTIKDPDRAVCPGTLGTAKIECRWRSAAWWVWYKLNDTFDLGLM